MAQTAAQPRYPDATRLLITADCGGSNGARVRLWKRELQVLADELGTDDQRLPSLPPGTSKWNSIEHRLFAFITQNWRGKPLVSHQVIVQLIANTKTKAGLNVACRLDRQQLRKGSRSLTTRWQPQHLAQTNSMASGTTPSRPRPPDH